jgi:exopolysaccharide/PEP-CTERM locus tyrosine autokinase
LGKIFNALEKAEQNQGLDSPESKIEKVFEHSIIDLPQKSSKDAPPSSLPDMLHESLITASRPNSMEAEQFRLLKTNLLFPEKGEPARTVMITSPSPNEGKSFVAANLAVSMAQSIDEYVLLIDCDLRNPTIHSLFGYNKGGHGLSDYLSSAMPLSNVLRKTSVEKLTILPGGTVPSNPSELLSSEQMRRMLHEVKLRYADRYILIDTPPPYITAETNAIARSVDGIILVVRQGKTRVKEVQDIIDIYGREKILGVVKNFSEKKFGYGYGYHKYGYHKYGYGKR